jgi:alpha-mannosidase
VKADNLVISALKKEDRGENIILRLYETEGRPAESAVSVPGCAGGVNEVNLLEEDVEQSNYKMVHATPFAIKTLKFKLESPIRPR